MKIRQFNTFPYGGAAYAARRLHDSLCNDGVDSRFYYWRNNDQELNDSYRQLEFENETEPRLLAPILRQQKKIRQRKIKKRYDKHIRPRSKDLEVFSGAQLLEKTRLDWNKLDGDIAHLHWLAFFVDYASFFASIPEHVPVVWTLHDMNPLTGGCHYSSGCTRFMVGCGNCPQLIHSHANDESSETFKVKKRALRRTNLTVVAPSQWMLDMAQSSQMFSESTRFELIQYGFELGRYRPIDPLEARQRLGLDNTKRYIGFGAEDINHRRKGFDLLLKSLRKLPDKRNVECVLFGGGKLPENLQGLPPINSVGFLDTADKKALVYSAMDFFVMPSLEDNSPQTGLEAMACGTPVIGFETGGVSEYVIPHKTGLLCSTGNVNQLSASIAWLAENPQAIKAMSIRSRQHMVQNFALSQQLGNYKSLYHDILGRSYSEYSSPMRAAA